MFAPPICFLSQENLLRKSLQEQPSDSHNIRPSRCESTEDVAQSLTRTTSATQTSPTDLVDWNQLPPVPQRSSSKVSDSGVGALKSLKFKLKGGGVEEGWWVLQWFYHFFVGGGGE